MLLLLLTILVGSNGSDLCIDERISVHRDHAWGVCEEGLSLERELHLLEQSDANEQVIAKIQTQPRVQVKPARQVRSTKRQAKVESTEEADDDFYLKLRDESRSLEIADIRLDFEEEEEKEEDQQEPETEETLYEETDSDFEIVDTDDVDFYSEAYHSHDRILNVSLAKTVRPGRLQLLVTHRTASSFLTNTFQDFAGFDNGGLKIGLGLRYGLLDFLDIGMMRVNGTFDLYDTYEFDLKIKGVDFQGFAAGIKLGTTVFYQPGNTVSGFFAQFSLEKILFERLLFAINTSYHTNSSNLNKKVTDSDSTCNTGGGLEFRVTDWFALSGDVFYSIVGFRKKFAVFAVGPKFISNRHTFSIVMTNSGYTTMDGLLTNSTNGEFNEFILGFNISREFDIVDME